MLKKILLPLFVVLLLASCHSKVAFDYNQLVVGRENALTPKINKTEDAVERFAALGQYNKIGAEGALMESSIDVTLQRVIDEPAPDAPNGEEMKNAAVEYFRYLKSIYTCYKEFGYAPSDEERELVRQRMLKIVGNKEAAIQKIKDVQKKFAKANGFRIEK